MISLAQAWVTQYMALVMYEQLKIEFFSTFWLQPTAVHILHLLNNLKQNWHSVYAYAAKNCKLVNLLDDINWLSDLIQCKTFLWGLDHNDPYIGMDLIRLTLDTLMEKVLKAYWLKTPITQVYGPAIDHNWLVPSQVGFGQVYLALVWQHPSKGS